MQIPIGLERIFELKFGLMKIFINSCNISPSTELTRLIHFKLFTPHVAQTSFRQSICVLLALLGMVTRFNFEYNYD